MRRLIGMVALGVLLTPAARGMVIDPDVDKDLAKLRRDIGKQSAKYILCLVKAATKCEDGGTSAAVECNLTTGAVAYDVPPGKPTQKFQDAIATCDENFNPFKKGVDYVGIGCPGDCDVVAPGVQRCADMAAYEALLQGTAGLAAPKVQLGILAAGINAACILDGKGISNTDPARIECVRQNAATLSRYSKKLLKCVAKCENDFKMKKGGGGPTNGPNCLSGDLGAHANFNTCDTDALLTAIAKEGPLSASNEGTLLPELRDAVNDATTMFYNRFDPTTTNPEFSPCGTCGNATREGAEVCDGVDDAGCPGACNPDCTCP